MPEANLCRNRNNRTRYRLRQLLGKNGDAPYRTYVPLDMKETGESKGGVETGLL